MAISSTPQPNQLGYVNPHYQPPRLTLKQQDLGGIRLLLDDCNEPWLNAQDIRACLMFDEARLLPCLATLLAPLAERLDHLNALTPEDQ